MHRLEDNISYLMSANNGEQDLVAGSVFATPEILSLFGSKTRIEIVEINADQQLAKVRLVHIPADVPQYLPEDGPYRNPGVAWFDHIGGRGDALIVVDGKVASIARRSPFFRTLEQIALFENSAAITSVRLQSTVREEALSTIANFTQEQMHRLQAFRQPAPP